MLTLIAHAFFRFFPPLDFLAGAAKPRVCVWRHTASATPIHDGNTRVPVHDTRELPASKARAAISARNATETLQLGLWYHKQVRMPLQCREDGTVVCETLIWAPQRH